MTVNDEDVLALGLDLGIHLALSRVILELIREILRIGNEINNCNNVNLVFSEKSLTNEGLEHEAANAAETVNCYFHMRGSPYSIKIYLIVRKRRSRVNSHAYRSCGREIPNPRDTACGI